MYCLARVVCSDYKIYLSRKEFHSLLSSLPMYSFPYHLSILSFYISIYLSRINLFSAAYIHRILLLPRLLTLNIGLNPRIDLIRNEVPERPSPSSLHTLNLANCNNIAPSTLNMMIRSCPQIQDLDLTGTNILLQSIHPYLPHFDPLLSFPFLSFPFVLLVSVISFRMFGIE